MVEYTPKIDLNWILNRVSQEQIYEHYLSEGFTIGGRIKSPLRRDNDPSFSIFYHYNGVLFWKDFRGPSGGIVQLVEKMFNLSYYEALYKIAQDLGLLAKKGDFNRVIYDFDKTIIRKKDKVLRFERRDLYKLDIDYWNEYGVDEATLFKYNVYPISKLWVQDNLTWVHSRYNPIYCFDEEPKYKFYRPLMDKSQRWIGNMTSNIIQGLKEIPKDYNGLKGITKARKDIMAIYNICKIYSIAPSSEGVIFKPDQLELIKDFDFSLYDFDLTGIASAKRLRKEGIKPLFMTTDRHNRRLDFSDYVKVNGKEKARDRLLSLLNEKRII